MRILYYDEEGAQVVEDIAIAYPETSGIDSYLYVGASYGDDMRFRMSTCEAQRIVNTLFETGLADLTSYKVDYVDEDEEM